MVDPILTSALIGIQKGLEGAADKVGKITRAFMPDSSGDPTESIVGLKLDQNQVKASGRVLQTAEELSKSVLDILA